MEPKNPLRITIVGSGNWGSAIALIVGKNAAKCDQFESKVVMWVHEEMVDGSKLTEIINQRHENVKYLPGKKLPENVFAEPNLVESCQNSDILVFVIPHQFVVKICNQLKGKLKANALVVSLIKGFMVCQKLGSLCLVSEEIQRILKVNTAVLMGANLAHEVANEDFCEATIGCRDISWWPMLKNLFESDNFRIHVTEDANTVELCGGLKNIVACASGIADGLGYGSNTKAAVIRLGLMEMTKFIELFYPGSDIRTFFESCGVADLVATCSGGRNRKVCEAFVKTGKSIQNLEQELLNGQSAQGPMTAAEVYQMLKLHNMISRFPLFVAVHQICQKQIPPNMLVLRLRECE